MARVNMTREGDCGVRTKELIARYYLALMGEFRSDSGMLYLSMDSADMFHNAITLILQDNGFQKLATDEDIMQKIRARIRAVISEIKQDHHTLKLEEYADNLQAKKEE